MPEGRSPPLFLGIDAGASPEAKGMFFGLTLGHDYRHLVRSAYEGISFGTRHILETLRDAGIQVREAVAGGGGLRIAGGSCSEHGYRGEQDPAAGKCQSV